MFCKHCGKEISDNSTICTGCGCSVAGNSANNGASAFGEPKLIAPNSISAGSVFVLMGLLYGLIMGIFFIVMFGIIGLIVGIVAGLLFGILMNIAISSIQKKGATAVAPIRGELGTAIVCEGSATMNKKSGWILLTQKELYFLALKNGQIIDRKIVERQKITSASAKGVNLVIRTTTETIHLNVGLAYVKAWEKALATV